MHKMLFVFKSMDESSICNITSWVSEGTFLSLKLSLLVATVFAATKYTFEQKDGAEVG